MHGRKPFEIELRKNQEISHLKKIKELKNSNTHYHRSLKREQQSVEALMKQTHVLHDRSMKLEMRRREKTEIETQRTHYDSIKSTLKKELDRKMLSIPEKQKPSNHFMNILNAKLVDKLVHVKSGFNFRKEEKALKYPPKRRDRMGTTEDYSKIYEKSMLLTEKRKKVFIRLTKGKDNSLVQLKFMDHQSIWPGKQNALYSIILEN